MFHKRMKVSGIAQGWDNWLKRRHSILLALVLCMSCIGLAGSYAGGDKAHQDGITHKVEKALEDAHISLPYAKITAELDGNTMTLKGETRDNKSKRMAGEIATQEIKADKSKYKVKNAIHTYGGPIGTPINIATTTINTQTEAGYYHFTVTVTLNSTTTFTPRQGTTGGILIVFTDPSAANRVCRQYFVPVSGSSPVLQDCALQQMSATHVYTITAFAAQSMTTSGFFDVESLGPFVGNATVSIPHL